MLLQYATEWCNISLVGKHSCLPQVKFVGLCLCPDLSQITMTLKEVLKYLVTILGGFMVGFSCVVFFLMLALNYCLF